MYLLCLLLRFIYCSSSFRWTTLLEASMMDFCCMQWLWRRHWRRVEPRMTVSVSRWRRRTATSGVRNKTSITILLILLQPVEFLLLSCAAVTYGNLTYRACPHISGYFSTQLHENIKRSFGNIPSKVKMFIKLYCLRNCNQLWINGRQCQTVPNSASYNFPIRTTNEYESPVSHLTLRCQLAPHGRRLFQCNIQKYFSCTAFSGNALFPLFRLLIAQCRLKNNMCGQGLIYSAPQEKCFSEATGVCWNGSFQQTGRAAKWTAQLAFNEQKPLTPKCD